MNISTQKEFTLKREEVTAFPVELTSEVSAKVRITFNGIKGGSCLYCEGKDYKGNSFVKFAELKAQKTKTLWCAFEIPVDAEAKEYKVTLCVNDENENTLKEEILTVTVTDEVADDTQFEDSTNLKRLVWLNSDFAINNTIPKPYCNVTTENNEIKILGRKLCYGKLGFPEKISTFFTEDIRIGNYETDILSAPISFNVFGENFANKEKVVASESDNATIHFVNESERFLLDVHARVEFDGYTDYKVTLTAKEDVEISDVNLTIPVSPECTDYFMGLGKAGGYFDRDIDFKWSSERHQDNFWVGAVNAGLRVKFTGENYIKPLVNIYYSKKPLRVPESWGGEDGLAGGIRFEKESCQFVAYSGKRCMKKGESLSYNFNLIITPLKPIDLEKHLGLRIYHRPPEEKIDIENRKGARIVNIHHGNDLNPYINYPFFENDALRKFTKSAHEKNLLVKLYYTIRELTIYMPEFKALRDFDYEIFEKCNGNFDIDLLWKGESKEWIKNTVGDDVIPAWRQCLCGDKYKGNYDASIITNGQSRLCNFYIEGLRYLVEHMEIDGLYIDDLAYDRETMKRVRRTIDMRPEAYIDFHTMNHHLDLPAYSNSINLYMELLPYIDKAWIGEGFDYNMPKDYWLVEISGIPFGLMGEMMCGGQPWRGLTFGMTTRLGWSKNVDPSNIWEVFDKYGLEKSTLIGFWDKRNTVELSNPNMVASMYKKEDKTYVVIANWTNEEQKGKITIGGEKYTSLSAPEIKDFQSAGVWGEDIVLEPGKAIFAELI